MNPQERAKRVLSLVERHQGPLLARVRFGQQHPFADYPQHADIEELFDRDGELVVEQLYIMVQIRHWNYPEDFDWTTKSVMQDIREFLAYVDGLLRSWPRDIEEEWRMVNPHDEVWIAKEITPDRR